MKIPREPEKPKSNQIGETTKAVAQTHPSPTQEIAPTATGPPRPAAVPLSEPPREGDLLGLSVQCLNGIWREFTGEPFVEHCI
jgi:hypothetical protein